MGTIWLTHGFPDYKARLRDTGEPYQNKKRRKRNFQPASYVLTFDDLSFYHIFFKCQGENLEKAFADESWGSSFIRFRLFEHVFQRDLRVMIPRVFDGFFPILNGFLWAPLQAGEALFASVKPRRFFIDHLDIVGRTNPRADSAAIAFVVHPETFIHFEDTPVRHLIDAGKQDVLPERSSVHIFSLPPKDWSGNRLYLFLGLPVQPLLSIHRSGTTPGGVIGRHDN